MPEDDNVHALPVRFKQPVPEERSVIELHEVGRSDKCCHLYTGYLVSEASAEVECAKCGAKLNPMWVLIRLARDDRRMETAAKRFQEETKRLAERSRTKCNNCGKMTEISRG